MVMAADAYERRARQAEMVRGAGHMPDRMTAWKCLRKQVQRQFQMA